MLGATGGRFLGPSGSQPHRNLWPSTAGRTIEFQTNGEVTESLFAAGGYNTPPASSPFMSVSPLELVAKNFHGGAVAFSQANSILVQSHTDFLSGTSVAKKTETCIGRWEHGNLEPLQINVPTNTNLTIKSENISSGSSRSCNKIDGFERATTTTHHHYNHHHTTTEGLLATVHSPNETIPSTTTNNHTINDLSSGCSRTIPISWTPHTTTNTNNLNDNSNSLTTTLLQIKREPCQVSEVTTSQNFGHHSHHQQHHNTQQLTAVVKIESPSPKNQMDHGTTVQNTGGAIPVGIAVARQRLQEHATNVQQQQQQQQQQQKDVNRFGIGIADLGGVAPSALSQNMFFTGTNSTMIPLTSEALTMGVSNVQNAVRTPPTLWQYPTPVSMESMLPNMLPMPPVGFQLVRDPGTGQFLFLPTTTLDKIYISYLEPFQQAVVWPTYPQTSIQPHLLLPPLAQQIQPPPLAPLQLLGSDYLATASTTLHQHTQTHSTRLVALTESKRKPNTTIPLPIPSHTLIKIEDCSGSTNGTTNHTTHHHLQQQQHHHHHHQATIFEQEKSTIQTATIATAVQTNDVPTQLYYQHPGNLIQITPTNHHHHHHQQQQQHQQPQQLHGQMASIEAPMDCRNNITPPLLQVPAEASTCMSPSPDQPQNLTTTCNVPEVQDANIQTDSLSEDENTNHGHDECSMPENYNDDTSNQCHKLDDNECDDTINNCDIIANSNSSSNNNSNNLNDSNNNNNIKLNDETPTSTNGCTVQIIENEKIETKLFGKCDIIKLAIPLQSNEIPEELNSITDTSNEYANQMSPIVTTTNYAIANSHHHNSDMNHMMQVQIAEAVATILPPPEICITQSERHNDNNVEEDEIIDRKCFPLVKPNMEMLNHTQMHVDVSGLELLSNSIEAFEKKAFIKKEPIDEESIDESGEAAPIAETIMTPNVVTTTTIELTDKSVVADNAELEGLNLLCALAEQRFQEEINQRNKAVSSPSSPINDNVVSGEQQCGKKRKHKHSKSSKKSKDKDRKKRKHSSTGAEHDDCEENDHDIDDDLKETLTKYTKCKNEKCCHEKCDYPTPVELFNAMEIDMKQKLADITKKCQEKKRELDEIGPLLIKGLHTSNTIIKSSTLFSSTNLTSSTPITSQSTSSIFSKITSIPVVSPNFSNSSQSESNLVELPKLSSDTDSSKYDDFDVNSGANDKNMTPSKRKLGIPKKHDNDNNCTETIYQKKKTLVGYILASKNRNATNTNVKGNKFFYSSSSSSPSNAMVTSGGEVRKKLASKIKLEDYDSNSCHSTFNASTNTTNNFQMSQLSSTLNFASSFKVEAPSCESPKNIFRESAKKGKHHHSKRKKSRSKDRKHHHHHHHHKKSSEVKERKRKIDSMCTLTETLLEKDGIRVITAMGGLFYAGRLSAIQPPDIYAVTLDGERGNRPHIMSREEVLRDAMIEVAPPSVDEIPPGTRICAFWSQQYRCLYPGTVAEPGTPDSINDKKFVSVEFDDGDNGRIAVEDTRYLLSDYPIVEYDPNPLLSLGKRKRRSSQNIPETNNENSLGLSKTNLFQSSNGNNDSEEDKNGDKVAQRERKRLKKIKKDKLKQQLSLDSSNGDVSANNTTAITTNTTTINNNNNNNTTTTNTIANITEQQKKHKRKHKCVDEFCKHRKHKKRRKHKKHHRENEVSAEDDVSSSRDDTDSKEKLTYEIINKAEILANNSIEPISKDSDFDPTIKEETMTEEEVASSITDSSGSFYEPKKKKERQNSAENRSKIAAFLPARQLWAWSGKGFRRSIGKGRQKRTFFRKIQRGKELISVGDSAVFLSTGRPDRPYIGRIESMWETSCSKMVVRVKWFYHPEETEGCPNLKFPGALFESPHEDENDVQTISHKCEVLQLPNYTKKFGPDPKTYTSIYDNNDTYYLAGHYDPTVKTIKFQPEIPVVNNDEETWA